MRLSPECGERAAQAVFVISYFALPPEFTGIFEDSERVVKNWHLFFCVACGLWGGLIIGIATEYFTSNRYQPVQVGLRKGCDLGPCTGASLRAQLHGDRVEALVVHGSLCGGRIAGFGTEAWSSDRTVCARCGRGHGL